MPDETKTTFTVRESLRAKLGHDGAAKVIRAMYDRAEKPKRPRRKKGA